MDDDAICLGVDTIVNHQGIEYQIRVDYAEKADTTSESIVYDFGQEAFAQFLILADGKKGDTLYVSIGECLKNGHVDTQPGVFRRYEEFSIPMLDGFHSYRPVIERKPYGKDTYAIGMPKKIGEVMPFRFVEVYNASDFQRIKVKRLVFSSPFNEKASEFYCDNEKLNRVWEFCKYSIKATSFSGYYIDGDRERRPYEADALINQLSHFAVEAYYPISYRTCQHLLDYPTWPTEWMFQTIMLAWNHYLYTGDDRILRNNYELLQLHALFELVDPDTKLVTTKKAICSFPIFTKVKRHAERYC